MSLTRSNRLNGLRLKSQSVTLNRLKKRGRERVIEEERRRKERKSEGNRGREEKKREEGRRRKEKRGR